MLFREKWPPRPGGLHSGTRSNACLTGAPIQQYASMKKSFVELRTFLSLCWKSFGISARQALSWTTFEPNAASAAVRAWMHEIAILGFLFWVPDSKFEQTSSAFSCSIRSRQHSIAFSFVFGWKNIRISRMKKQEPWSWSILLSRHRKLLIHV